MAKRIGEAEGADLLVVELAALLRLFHDLKRKGELYFGDRRLFFHMSPGKKMALPPGPQRPQATAP